MPVINSHDEIVARFEIPFRRYLGEDGSVLRPLPEALASPDTAIPLYHAMLRARAFDTRAVALQRTGRLGTYASALGQEAVSVGLASAMRSEDVLLPSFREHGAQLWRGVTPVELFLYWGGDERGSNFAGPREDFPDCVPVATQAPHAVGVAMAFVLRNEARVAVCVLGDGATSKGDFSEAVNAAGVWRLPLVFVITNNQWAISTRRTTQTAAVTLAQKAIAGGVDALQVDGNDVLAVADAVGEACEGARARRPTVIEAVTFRLGDHTTSDDSRRYRDDAAVQAAWQAEPISRLRRYLVRLGAWTDADEASAVAAAATEIDAAADAYLASPPPPPASMWDFTYAQVPAALARERHAQRA
jgi:pyruvate dehydrogenase E1 component alpha subunit